MPKVYQAMAVAGEFCESLFPNPQVVLWDRDPKVHLQHRLICCDCGLSHDFEFVVVEVRKKRDGVTSLIRVAPKKYSLQFRVRRNERSTAQVRRKRQAKR